MPPSLASLATRALAGPRRRLLLAAPLVLAVVVAGGEELAALRSRLEPHPAAQARPLVLADRRAFATHTDALRESAAIISNDLGLPIPDKYSVFVYPTRERFREGLVHDAHIAPGRAAELAEFAIGVGKRRVLLFNDEDSVGRGREWVRLVAHELTHLAQFEIAEGEGRGEQWLVEGMAEWSAFTVLERLELDTITRRRRVSLRGVHDRGVLSTGRIDLETLGNPRGFTRRHVRDGSLPIYQLAFLMADYLIEREGMERVVGYFESFRTGGGRHENFERAFKQRLTDFETEVSAHLWGMPR